MPQNVMVSVMGEGEYMTRLVQAILQREVIRRATCSCLLKIKPPVRRPRAIRYPCARMSSPR